MLNKCFVWSQGLLSSMSNDVLKFRGKRNFRKSLCLTEASSFPRFHFYAKLISKIQHHIWFTDLRVVLVSFQHKSKEMYVLKRQTLFLTVPLSLRPFVTLLSLQAQRLAPT